MHTLATRPPQQTILATPTATLDTALIEAANAWILNPESHALHTLIPDPPTPKGGAQGPPVGPVSTAVHQAVERITGRPLRGHTVDARGEHAAPNTANARSALKRNAARKESLLRS